MNMENIAARRLYTSDGKICLEQISLCGMRIYFWLKTLTPLKDLRLTINFQDLVDMITIYRTE